jgi:hypothetical protein
MDTLGAYFENLEDAVRYGKEFELSIMVEDGKVDVKIYHGNNVVTNYYDLETVSAAILACNHCITDVLSEKYE